MAVSGSKDFSVTRTQIIEAAYRKIGIFDIGEGVSGEQSSAASLALNMLIKEWLARGADIHLRQDMTLFLQPNQTSYVFSSTSTDKYTNDTVVETTLSADEASGQTEISVTAETGMTVSDNIGIKIDDGTIHWSTISSLATLTIADATDGAASSGNKVYAYTNRGDVPRKILYAYRRDTNGIDTPVGLIGENDYQSLSDKDADGAPTQIFYRAQTGQGTLRVWPTKWSSGDKLVLITQVFPDDFDAASNSPDFPISWANTLVWGLAAEIAPENGVPAPEQDRLVARAEAKLRDMMDNDVENASVVFEMDFDR
jgi:hypothetical protein